ncbi:hypothetical protein NQ317_000354, partial [Molorchus minor]
AAVAEQFPTSNRRLAMLCDVGPHGQEAYHPKYMTEQGEWMSDLYSKATCFKDKMDILNYCKKPHCLMPPIGLKRGSKPTAVSDVVPARVRQSSNLTWHGACNFLVEFRDSLQLRSESIPQEIKEAATRATLDLLPTKSKKQYELAYKRFVEWCDRNNRKGEGYRQKKSKIFIRQNIDKFIAEAPDDKYLMFKVVAAMGILGACRREELCQMNLNNIEDLGNTLVVNIPDSKTRVSRTFTVITETYIDLYPKYLALRLAHVNHQRLFIKYTSKKCTIQPVGINIFGKMPTDIARFLKLPNSELYTGHCFVGHPLAC